MHQNLHVAWAHCGEGHGERRESREPQGGDEPSCRHSWTQTVWAQSIDWHFYQIPLISCENPSFRMVLQPGLDSLALGYSGSFSPIVSNGAPSGFSPSDWVLSELPFKLNVPIVTLPPSPPLKAPPAPSARLRAKPFIIGETVGAAGGPRPGEIPFFWETRSEVYEPPGDPRQYLEQM